VTINKGEVTMLQQLKEIADQKLYEFGSDLLVDQALWLALTDQVKWKRHSDCELHAEISIALPGKKPLPTTMTFGKSFSSELGFVGYYFNLENGDGPGRTSADERVEALAQKIFVSQTQQAA
jgi:hypothetical protein